MDPGHFPWGFTGGATHVKHMTTSSRRNFLSMLAASFALDPERLLWKPGAKLISIPKAVEFTPLLDQINIETLMHLRRDMLYDNFFTDAAWRKSARYAAMDGGETLQQPLVYR